MSTTQLAWFKGSYSGVEVASQPGGVRVRDSKRSG